MKRCGWSLAGLFCLGISAHAQSSLDMLERDLNQFRQEHEEMSAKNLDVFLSQLETASQSSAAAVNLYQRAGGIMPEPTPVKKKNQYETPDEKAARLAQDQAQATNLGGMLQLHCGMMRLAALFVEKPNSRELNDDWLAWLKSAARVYPQVIGADDIRKMAMRDSPISAYLGFQGWGDKEQGLWEVGDIPKLYRTQILEPLRTPLSANALPAWDVYIALKKADQPDLVKWTKVEYPTLLFDRACDDFHIQPNTDKLEALVAIIKANPTHEKVDEWIAQVHAMLENYKRQRFGAAPAPREITNFIPPAAPPPAVVRARPAPSPIPDPNAVPTPTPLTNAAPASMPR